VESMESVVYTPSEACHATNERMARSINGAKVCWTMVISAVMITIQICCYAGFVHCIY
jgi:hypothetical protein